jgi:D-galactarolactone cycloisomerase
MGALAAWQSPCEQEALGADPTEPNSKPSSLTVTKVETFTLRHKLAKAIGPSVALSPFREALIVKISTDSGLVGWGETADVGGTKGIIDQNLGPNLVGKNPLEHRKLWRELWAPNFGDGRAMGGVDIALNDLRGKALGQSIADMYGGRMRDKIMAYAAAMNYVEGVKPEDQHPKEAAELVKRGFKAMKIRTGRYGHKRDLGVMVKIREAVGPDTILLTDGNGAFTFPAAVKFGKELEKLDFYCFEEPLPEAPNYAGYSDLAAAMDIALAGGEVLDSRATARDHVVKRSFDIIQPDVTLCGGVAEVLFIAEMSALWSVQCVPHCWGSALAIAATVQLLSLLPDYTWAPYSDSPLLEIDVYENPFREELITRPFKVEKDGYVTVPRGPGLGVEINEEIIKKYAVKG